MRVPVLKSQEFVGSLISTEAILIIQLAVRNGRNIVRLLSVEFVSCVLKCAEEFEFGVLKSEWSLRSNTAEYPSFIPVKGCHLLY